MAKASDDLDWMDELAGAREGEVDDGGEHPVEAGDEEVGEAADESVDTKGDDRAGDEGDSKTVPLATLLEERNRQQARIDALEQRLSQSDERFEKLQGLRDELERLKTAQAQPAPQPVDYLEDPKAYIDQSTKSVVDQLEALGNQIKNSEKVQEETKEQLQQQVAVQRIQSAAAASEEAFAEKTEDYWDALAHLRQVRRVQLEALFPKATPEQVDHQMRMEEFQTAAMVLQNGGSPAQTAYTLAKSMGYTAQNKARNADNQEDLDEKRDRAQGLGGSGLPSSPAIDNLMGMEKDEFDQAMSEMFGSSAR